MKRFLIATFLLVWATSPIAAQEEAVKCPAKLETIEDCPLTGCSGSKIDPRLNAQKNIRKDNHAATDKDFADLAQRCPIQC